MSSGVSEEELTRKIEEMKKKFSHWRYKKLYNRASNPNLKYRYVYCDICGSVIIKSLRFREQKRIARDMWIFNEIFFVSYRFVKECNFATILRDSQKRKEKRHILDEKSLFGTYDFFEQCFIPIDHKTIQKIRIQSSPGKTVNIFQIADPLHKCDYCKDLLAFSMSPRVLKSEKQEDKSSIPRWIFENPNIDIENFDY